MLRQMSLAARRRAIHTAVNEGEHVFSSDDESEVDAREDDAEVRERFSKA